MVSILGVAVITLGLGFAPLSPSPTNPLCYNSQIYRDTHEQECLIDRVQAKPSTSGNPGGGGGGSIFGPILGNLPVVGRVGGLT